jgi:hypothetical protein
MTRLNVLAHELNCARERIKSATLAARRAELEIADTLGLGGGTAGYRTATVEDWVVSVASLGDGVPVVRIEKREAGS